MTVKSSHWPSKFGPSKISKVIPQTLAQSQELEEKKLSWGWEENKRTPPPPPISSQLLVSILFFTGGGGDYGG